MQLAAIAHPLHLGDRVFGHEDLHRAKHPLHELLQSASGTNTPCMNAQQATHQGHIDKIFLRHGLGVHFREELNRFRGRGLDLGCLSEERDGEVIVHLVSEEGICPGPVLWDGVLSGFDIEALDRHLVQCDAPSYEPVPPVSLTLQQPDLGFRVVR